MQKILVVDDDVRVRDVAAACLRDHGMAPLFAENGKAALRLLESERPDAVLTDLNMPQMNGLELVEYMREHHSDIPVVLMTSRGSEEEAVAALRAGALSYVPKRELRGSLCNAMRTVVAAVEAKRRREETPTGIEPGDSHYVLGFELEAAIALVSHLQANLESLQCCDDTDLFRVSTALGEAFSNAIDHGNLEMDSRLRERRDDTYEQLRHKRAQEAPYCNRRVHVTERVTEHSITYVVRDEGNGFDVSSVPDPTDSGNLLKASGRGLMLIRTFMDEVLFNDTGNEIIMVKRRNGH
jgi:DNA-binding response OmpR family regulator